MSEKTLWLLRGVSSCGKTTLAKTLQQQFDVGDEDALTSCYSVAADDFFYDDEGKYCFDVNKLSDAHWWCQDMVDDFMDLSIGNIIVHNTLTTEKEMKPYLDMAEKYGYKVVSLVVEKRHDSTNNHEVPEHALKRQEQRLRGSLKLR